jgi:hypothetical protein
MDFGRGNLVCNNCVEETDLRNWIRTSVRSITCSYCQRESESGIEFDDLIERIEDVLFNHFDRAIDELPYDGREGGFQGTTFETSEVFAELNLGCHEKLYVDLVQHFSDDEPWCEKDHAMLDPSTSMISTWKLFANTTQHQRRFFFARHHKPIDDFDLDHIPFEALLTSIARTCENHALVGEIAKDTAFFRAREDKDSRLKKAHDFGPPPRELCTQSNRMNPPGVPMMYVSSTKEGACAEVGSDRVTTVGRLVSRTKLRVLDLSKPVVVPGYFSGADRHTIHASFFLQHFVEEITRPIAREDRNRFDYVPSQIVTELSMR